MSVRSIRIRLLMAAALAILAALVASWLLLTVLFERHVERRVESDLTRIAEQLASSIRTTSDGKPTLSQEPGDPRFTVPASGFYWQVASDRGEVRSRSLWDQALPVSAVATTHRWAARLTPGPHEPEVLIVERVVHPERDSAAVLIQVASENTSLLQARREFGVELALYLAVLWAVLSSAAWLQVKLGLAPLQRLSAEMQALKRNTLSRLSVDHPPEVEPLVRAINGVADARESDLQKARRRSADLAHAMRTPLAAMAAQTRRARESGASEAAEGLEKAIHAATWAVESELIKSRLAVVHDASYLSQTDAASCVEAVLGVVERTDAGSRLSFESVVGADVLVPVAREDLLEVLGALLENASRYARRRVRVSGEPGASPRLVIEDDGPGIPDEFLADALVRGRRLDERGPGFGLGLSIVQELAQATGATVALSRSVFGGLRVDIQWSPRAARPT